MSSKKGSFTYVAGKKYDGMMGRCYRTSDNSFKNYGGRGIRVCSAWIKDIECFRMWLLNELAEQEVTPETFAANSSKYTLDRIDPEGHYGPDNCRIVSPQGNIRNTRNNRLKELVSAEGEIIKFGIGMLFCALLVSGCGNEDFSIPGPRGDAGPVGSGCSVSQTAHGANITCTDGTFAELFDGQVGPQGLPGSDGAPGTSISSIKLCANDTSGFPEYAIKIGTTLYAVYWNNTNAWLALLTPGNYMSTNGSGCYFSVDANGNVSQY